MRTARRWLTIILGVLLGFVVWFAVATAGNFLVRWSIAGYTQAEPTLTFTLPMMLARLGVGALSSVAAGLVCAAALRSAPDAARFLALALLLFFLPVHYALRAQFPLWYHLAFLVPLAPLVLVGAALARPRS
jgi:hypothetical protein